MFTCPLIIWFRSELQQQRKVRQLPTRMWMGRAFVTVEPTNTRTKTNTHPHWVSEYAQWLKNGLGLSWVKGTLSFMLYLRTLFLEISTKLWHFGHMSIKESRVQRYANFRFTSISVYIYKHKVMLPIKDVPRSTLYSSSQGTDHLMKILFRDR